MRALIALFCLTLGASATVLCAEVVPLWAKGQVPGSVTANPEKLERGHVYNVSEPTLERFPAPNAGQTPLPAILVAPGGGYACLAYEKEGVEVARWLNRLGYHAAVLKYRIPNDRPGARVDAQQALKVLREPAPGWVVDTQRVGMIGFSAGAHLTASVLAQQAHGLAFALLVYPAYLSADGATLAPEVVPATPTVPTFLTQCRDDRAYVHSSLGYAGYLLRANCPVTYHLYTSGGHGYGLRKPLPSEAAHWPLEAATWLQTVAPIPKNNL